MIELLIVVGILAVLAGVVTLGITQFIGKGKAEAAKTELHNVQTLVTGLMSENQVSLIDPDKLPTELVGIGGPGDGIGCMDTLIWIEPPTTYDISNYMATPLTGKYSVRNDGKVLQTAYPDPNPLCV